MHCNSDSEGSGSESDHEPEPDRVLGIDVEDCCKAAHAIARSCDMFCNITQAVKVALLAQNEQDSDVKFGSDDKDSRKSWEGFLKNM